MSRKVIAAVEAALVGLSVIALGAYLYVAIARLTYPFSLEWLESNTFLQVTRVLQRRPLYEAPSYTFIPLLYTPLYYYVSAGLAALTGQIMVAMRLTSMLASLLASAMVYTLCRLRRVSRPASAGAVGLFAASYAVSGYWFDIAKMDSLFLALMLSAYVLTMIRAKRDHLVGALAGVVIFLSFATKQQALLAVPFLPLWLIVERRWAKALWLCGAFTVSAGTFVLAMNSATTGWFWFYVQVIPSAHPVFAEMIAHDFWTLYLLPSYPYLIAAIIIAAIALLARRNRAATLDSAAFALTFFLPLLTMSVISMAHQWGWINNLLPVTAALAVMGGEAYQQVALAARPGGPVSRLSIGAYLLVSALIIAQFVELRYDPRPQIPATETTEAGEQILDIIRAARGPIFIPTSPYLLYMEDQPTHFQASSMGDLDLAAQHDPTVSTAVKAHQDAISTYIWSGAIQTAILPNAPWYDAVFSAENGYNCESLVAERPPLITMTGARSYLDRICRRYSGSTPIEPTMMPDF